MTVNLRHVRAFLAVARLGSFTRAAAELHASQPAITVQVREFEERIGLRLFDRNTRGVSVTRAGQELARRLERLQGEFDAVIAETREMAAGRRGVVRLACLQSVASTVLPPAIARFWQQHPLIRFSIKDVSGARTLDMVRDGVVDFGLVDMPSTEPALEFEPLLGARLHVVMPPGHPLHRVRRITLARIAQHPLILMDRETSARRLVDAAFAQAGCQPQCVGEVVALSSALAMVRFGAGITVLPVSAHDGPLHTGVVVRPVHDYSATRWIGVVRRVGRSLPPPSEAFIATLRAQGGDASRRAAAG
jgi:DNA-binding transcriptional LysR family regulator